MEGGHGMFRSLRGGEVEGLLGVEVEKLWGEIYFSTNFNIKKNVFLQDNQLNQHI